MVDDRLYSGDAAAEDWGWSAVDRFAALLNIYLQPVCRQCPVPAATSRIKKALASTVHTVPVLLSRYPRLRWVRGL